MDQEGIDVAYLYPSLGLYFGAIEDPEVAAACCRAYNTWVAEYCQAAPDRLKPVANLPLQSVELSIAEARRAVDELGMSAVLARPNPYAGRRLDDPAYDPLWAVVQELDVPLGIHEGTTTKMPTVGSERYPEPFRLHVISHVFEQMLACMDLTAGGVLEKFPRLRVMFLESSGGWICTWLDRLDHQAERLNEARTGIKLSLKPSEYFARQCWISFDPGERMLKPTVAEIGADRLIWASDYPHFDGFFPGAVELLQENLAGLPEADKEKIAGLNAAEIYGLR